MSLAHSIWDEVLAQVQSHRLSAERPAEEVADDCRDLASAIARAREAEALELRGETLSDDDRAWLDTELEALLGSGPLERYLRRDDVENVWLFGPRRGALGLAGGRQEPITDPLFADDAEMIGFIAHLAVTHGQTGRRFDHSAPLLDLRLRTGERLFAAMDVCGAPYLTVRCHRHRAVSLAELAEAGSLSVQAAQFLAAAVRPPAPANVLICGALGSGKTTLLRALLGEIGPSEIVCTLEQTFELFLDDSHPWVFAAETREPNSDGEGEIGMEELARRSLRSGADRVIVGELRGPEAATFLSACGTGSDGSMATIHASSPRQALARLVRYCLASGLAGAQSALIGEAAEVVHLVIHMGTDPRTGHRGIRQISEVLGAPADRFEVRDIFARSGRAGPLELLGRPRNPDLAERIAEGGLDMSDWPEGS
ncbi:MAG: CpaF family protein [Acidimicrobiales bacterium]|nr:CpaF family protein [Acidimicrobiales bacterium]MYH73544.1 CpaF family protein [Acidimicrobiales bacterium]MYK70165.1 CpaF family protein [Acidimicrobiales bacterium]